MLHGIETEENILRFLDSADLSFHFFNFVKFYGRILSCHKSLALLLLYQSVDLNLSFTVLELSSAKTAYASFSADFS